MLNYILKKYFVLQSMLIYYNLTVWNLINETLISIFVFKLHNVRKLVLFVHAMLLILHPQNKLVFIKKENHQRYTFDRRHKVIFHANQIWEFSSPLQISKALLTWVSTNYSTFKKLFFECFRTSSCMHGRQFSWTRLKDLTSTLKLMILRNILQNKANLVFPSLSNENIWQRTTSAPSPSNPLSLKTTQWPNFKRRQYPLWSTIKIFPPTTWLYAGIYNIYVYI